MTDHSARALAGATVVSSLLAVERRQIRFPRSKRRRIRKKWAKDQRNFEERPAAFLVDPSALGLADRPSVIAHPAIVEMMHRRGAA